ncbi:DUF1540 domain-containing protein [Acetanaerobacterium sp. MSJ-12]|uniref:DUF1540 domain-containing protein n=1 Tax=Bittarella massiliensis (ex Durand et al. 2017) TaxID=1720313 RepID=A0AAW5KCA6_9FIRM|nr:MULTISPECIES: DUF1540 domain-containing protein [Eubacteriales]MBU5419444.1 DUF1540 domain-containing protein [Acetanaerobacterium sp. MSJ-12]MCB5940979.1 DUF1540 domain-containing protein [bacterium 210820-DFI.6.52]ERJ00388.1 hypothetical protein HMPREF0262_00796 [Clostridium sp. ATCC 29733]MBC2870603.1 DUF1540 domain-containing protein [Bittarella massiliensis (ex Durand et al. 2017)]MCQ4948970.1 DUF1540 domain-containing protein [Bittarella massiliensis (ex Durand et al. 2017)]
MKKSKPGPIPQVVCDVENCIYNRDRRCTAADIQVGPHFACSCCDTICSTFHPKEGE